MSYAGLDLVYRYLILYSNSSFNSIMIHYCFIMKRYIHLVATKQDFPFGKKSLYFCLSNCEELLVGLFTGVDGGVDEVGELTSLND